MDYSIGMFLTGLLSGAGKLIVAVSRLVTWEHDFFRGSWWRVGIAEGEKKPVRICWSDNYDDSSTIDAAAELLATDFIPLLQPLTDLYI